MATRVSRRGFARGAILAGVSAALSSPSASGAIADLAKFCRCDGTPDDEGIARALRELPHSGGVAVLPPKPIVIAQPLVIDKSRVTLAGFGPSSRIITRGEIDGVVIRGDRPLEHILLSDFEIAAENSSANKGGYGIRFMSPGVTYPEINL